MGVRNSSKPVILPPSSSGRMCGCCSRAVVRGQGLGIRLCELPARRAGGALEIAPDAPDCTQLLLRLPAA